MGNLKLSVVNEDALSTAVAAGLPDLSSVETKDLIEMMQTLGEQFADSVKRAKSPAEISAFFSKIYHTPIMIEAGERAAKHRGTKIKLIRAFQQGAQYLYQISGGLDAATNKYYGYPGDFTVLESVYDRVPHVNTENGVGTLVDLWCADTVLPRAVTARKDSLKMFLSEYAKSHADQGAQAKVLSIASGSAREIREISPHRLSGLDITLLDRDPRAMAFAKEFFNTRSTAIDIKTIEADALDRELPGKVDLKNNFDLVYSFGLYDYLNDEQLLTSIEVGKEMMKDDGTFVFCLKDHRYYDRWFYELMMSWGFHKRTIEDGYRLCQMAGLRLREQIIVDGRAVIIYVCEKA